MKFVVVLALFLAFALLLWQYKPLQPTVPQHKDVTPLKIECTEPQTVNPYE